MKEFNRPTMLMILDGYGINQDTYGNAIGSSGQAGIWMRSLQNILEQH